ncbi:hypothetical protein D3C72_1244540 [compost metagenome]
MVHLVLHADRQQAIGGQFLRLPLAVQELDGDGVGTGHVSEDAGHRQATFLIHLAPVLGDDFRVDEHARLVLFFAHVDDHEALVHVHLAGSQADAGGVVHGLEHVVEQLLERRRGHFGGIDQRSLGTQARIGELKDGE